MKLLDFPVELIRSIIETTVQDVGLRPSVKLREVCKTFDKEVMRSFEMLSIFSFDESTKFVCRDKESHWRGDWARPIIPFLARFIEGRPYEANREPTVDGLELWQTSLPCLLNRILDDLDVDPEDRFGVLVCLLQHHDDHAETGVENVDVPGIIRTLINGDFGPSSEARWSSEHLSNHILMAAILLKKRARYHHLSGHPPAASRDTSFSEILGTPIWAAIKSKQYDLVNSQLPSSFPPGEYRAWSDPIVAAVETGDFHMAQLLVPFAWAKRATNMERLESALIRCAQRGDVKMGELLICTAIEQGADIGIFGDGYREAIFRCALFGDLPFIELLYQLRGPLDLLDLDHGDTVYPIAVAAWTGRIEVLQWFLDQKDDLRNGHIHVALRAAIHGDQVESLRCLMEDCFGDDDEDQDLNPRNWQWPAKIIEGLHLKSYRSIQYLVQDALVITTPKDIGQVFSMAVTGGHIEVIEMFIDLGWQMDEPLLTRNDFDWTPIMYAYASNEPGARLIEQRLYQLGIKPVDMTKFKNRTDLEWQRLQPFPSYKSSMPEDIRLKEIKQESAQNVVFINDPKREDQDHNAQH